MSNISLLKSAYRFKGDWNSSTVYNSGDLVKGSSGSAYLCQVDNTTGTNHNPISDNVNWNTFIATTNSALSGVTGSQVDRVSTTTFGINAGSTSNWYGQEWTLEKSGNQVNLVRMKQNCNCNCNCNCSIINCDCASNCHSDCNCTSTGNCYNCYNCYTAACASNCVCTAQGYWIQADCDCTWPYNYSYVCNCTSDCYSNCNCASNCNCNCSPI